MGKFGRRPRVVGLLEVSSLGLLRVQRYLPPPYMLLRPPLEYKYQARLMSAFGADAYCSEGPAVEAKVVSLTATLSNERIRVQRCLLSRRVQKLDVIAYKL